MVTMDRPEFIALCKGIEDGEERYVEDRVTHRAGKIIACMNSGHFEVEVEGRKSTWPAASCRERWDLQSRH